MKRPSETALAYIAGFFDGDGHVSCSMSYTGAVHYRITMCNTNPKVLEFIQSCLDGGKIIVSNSNNDNEKHRTAYSWMPRNRDEQIKFLKMILPYTVIKRRQIKLVLELYHRWNAGVKMSKGELKERRAIIDEIKAEKHKIWDPPKYERKVDKVRGL